MSEKVNMADENKTELSISDDSKITPDKTSSEPETSCKDVDDDKELDDLLDSALEDFDKPAPVISPPPDPEPSQEQACAEPDQPPIALPSTTTPFGEELSSQQEALFNELFKLAGTEQEGDVPGQGQLEAMMQQFMTHQPDLMQQADAMAENPSEAFTPEGGGTFEETLQQTLGSLAQNVQNVQELQGQTSETDLLQMLSGMGLDGGEGGEGGDLDFMPMMQNMMKGLMSKEVLYPSLKEITDKYPAWLEENSTKVPSKDYENYTKQYHLMKTIVTEFEQEKPEDSEPVKQTRFQKIMDTMQDMQSLGQPPKDIVGDMPAGMELDANGLPKFPPSPDQCSVM